MDLALARLPQKLVHQAREIGLAAQMADDDPSWALVSASVQLGTDHLQHLIGVAVARELRHDRRRACIPLTAAVACALLTMAIGAWAGAHGWLDYQRSDLADIERRIAAAMAVAPPEWFVRWARDSDGNAIGVLSGLSSGEVIVYECAAAQTRGVCVGVSPK